MTPSPTGEDQEPAPSTEPALPPRRAGTSFSDQRRGKLSQLDVLSGAPPLRSLRYSHVLCTAFAAAAYAHFVLPRLSTLGSQRWHARVLEDPEVARPGGLFSEVNLSYIVMLCLGYVSLSFLGVTRMGQRPAPVRIFVFEVVAVHNVTQCLFNLYCFIGLLAEGHAMGLRVWGNMPDASERGHALGHLIWLQYHCRQLQLLETAFMILQKKFQGLSFLHLYLRMLNLWGWFFACRFVCGGEAYFPALVSSACQLVVYGLYSSFSLWMMKPLGNEGADAEGLGRDGSGAGTGSPGVKSKGAKSSRVLWVYRLQIAQYVICAVHSLAASTWGNFPRSLAALHIFVIANGLVLYTDFHSQKPRTDLSDGPVDSVDSTTGTGTPRVTFSFDSSGWLFVYHFGVGLWLSEHLGQEDNPGTNAELPAGVAFSGSSGGSLISCVLAAGIQVRAVFEFVLEKWPECRRNPLLMFPAVEQALRHFQYAGAHKRLKGRLRILLTRVTWRPPFFMGEVAEDFPDNETSLQVLCASCHVPVVAGVLPSCVAGRYYYDGLLWPSRLLVPWRSAKGDHVVRISACGVPLADVRMLNVPFWWSILPPNQRVLRGLFWCGYRDIAKWVIMEPREGRQPSKSEDGTGGMHRSGSCSSISSRSSCNSANNDQEGDRPQRLLSRLWFDGLGMPGDLARWQAVQAVLQTKPLRGLPETDPVTGEGVVELIKFAESTADRSIRTASRVVTVLIVAGVPLVLAAIPTLLESSG